MKTLTSLVFAALIALSAVPDRAGAVVYDAGSGRTLTRDPIAAGLLVNPYLSLSSFGRLNRRVPECFGFDASHAVVGPVRDGELDCVTNPIIFGELGHAVHCEAEPQPTGLRATNRIGQPDGIAFEACDYESRVARRGRGCDKPFDHEQWQYHYLPDGQLYKRCRMCVKCRGNCTLGEERAACYVGTRTTRFPSGSTIVGPICICPLYDPG